MNIALAVAGLVVGLVLVAFVWKKGKGLEPPQPSDDEEADRQRLISEEEEGY